jgi:hypothetical protein
MWSVFENVSLIVLAIAGPRLLLSSRSTNFAIVVYMLAIAGWVLPLSWLPFYLIPLTLLSRRSCLQCGYDLRASNSRCPECGTPVRSTVVRADEPGTAGSETCAR